MIIKPNVLTYDGESRPERPSPLHFWKNGAWELDLGLLKQDAITRLAKTFENALTTGFTTSLSIKMDATLDALQSLKTGYDFALLLGETKMTIVDYNNAAHTDLPIADVAKIMAEVGGNYRNLYMLKQQIRGQVMAATTPQQVTAVAWPSNLGG